MRLQVADAATEMLGVLDEAAAMDNDRIALFASEVGHRAACLAHCIVPGRCPLAWSVVPRWRTSCMIMHSSEPTTA